MGLTYAIDERRPPARDWNGKLHVVNASPLSKPYPRDRLFWIVTDDCLAVEVSYSDQHMFWTGRETYCRQDGEAGSWEPDEIMGWTDSYEDAQEAAALLALVVPAEPEVSRTLIADLRQPSGPGQVIEKLSEIGRVPDIETRLRHVKHLRGPAGEAVEDRPALSVQADVEPRAHDVKVNAPRSPAQSRGDA